MNSESPEGAGAAGADPERAPHLDESVRRITAAGRDTLGAARDSLRALRRLVAADVALARAALVRSLAWLALAVVFGVSVWLLLVAMLVTALYAAGLGWLGATATAGAICLAATALAGWRAVAFLNHAGLHATRRQLTRMGLLQEDEEDGDGDAVATRAEARTT